MNIERICELAEAENGRLIERINKVSDDLDERIQTLARMSSGHDKLKNDTNQISSNIQQLKAQNVDFERVLEKVITRCNDVEAILGQNQRLGEFMNETLGWIIEARKCGDTVRGSDQKIRTEKLILAISVVGFCVSMYSILHNNKVGNRISDLFNEARKIRSRHWHPGSIKPYKDRAKKDTYYEHLYDDYYDLVQVLNKLEIELRKLGMGMIWNIFQGYSTGLFSGNVFRTLFWYEESQEVIVARECLKIASPVRPKEDVKLEGFSYDVFEELLEKLNYQILEGEQK